MWSFDPGTDDWSRFHVARGDTCLIPVYVGGANTEAILDSGSGATLIDSSFAQSIGLERGEARTMRGLSGAAQVSLIHDFVVRLGGADLRLPFVVVSDLRTVSAAFGRPINLLIGADVFRTSAFALDFQSKQFALRSSGNFTGGPEWRRLPLSHGERQVLMTSASIAGRPTQPLMVDLGNSNPMLLSSAYVAEQHLTKGRSVSSAALGGVDGVTQVSVFTVDELELAGFKIRDVPTLGLPTWQVSPAIGNIGLPILAQFDVVFDVPAGELWLREPKADRRLPLLKERSGLGFAAEPDRLRVVHISRGSPAAEGGWKIGDEIVAINGAAVDPAYTTGDQWRWRYRPPGTKVALTRSDGSVRALELADYF